MALQEKFYFVRSLRESFVTTGAVLPTSIYAARAMAAEMARREGPRAILEVGPGTGAITAGIIEALRPDDTLVLCELNDEFVVFLRKRFEEDPAFKRVAAQVTLVHGDVTQLDRQLKFDHIISAIPFTNLPAEVVEAILGYYQEVLKPNGTLTYIEYAYLRLLKRQISSAAQREQSDAASAVLDDYLARYEFRRDTAVRNVPPAWVHHLRFQAPQPQDALALRPAEHNRRIPLGNFGVSTEATPWIAALLALTRVGFLRRLRWLLWALIALVGAFFRDPARRAVANERLAYAASDGRVLSVERVRDPRFGEGEWLRIAVFLSIADVHINRSPVAGKIVETVHQDGGYAAAYADDADKNLAAFTVIDGAHGRCIVAQRVGMVARRIVGWVQPGELVAQGDRFGLIRFGSRTDVYLPADEWRALVGPNTRVWGGETPIAEYVGG